MTPCHWAVILNVEKVLPANGQTLEISTEVTALFGWRGGYFFFCLCKQADKANDKKAASEDQSEAAT